MKSYETRIAELNVDASLVNFENAVNQLIERVEVTADSVSDKISDVIETVQAPVVAVRQVTDFGRDTALTVVNRVRRNPEPFVSFALLAVGVWLCYRVVRRSNSYSNKHSWSQRDI